MIKGYTGKNEVKIEVNYIKHNMAYIPSLGYVLMRIDYPSCIDEETGETTDYPTYVGFTFIECKLKQIRYYEEFNHSTGIEYQELEIIEPDEETFWLEHYMSNVHISLESGEISREIFKANGFEIFGNLGKHFGQSLI